MYTDLHLVRSDSGGAVIKDVSDVTIPLRVKYVLRIKSINKYSKIRLCHNRKTKPTPMFLFVTIFKITGST